MIWLLLFTHVWIGGAGLLVGWNLRGEKQREIEEAQMWRARMRHPSTRAEDER